LLREMRGGRGEERRAAAAAARVCDRSVNPLRQAVCLGWVEGKGGRELGAMRWRRGSVLESPSILGGIFDTAPALQQ
jgi:hypothetical protein